MSLLSNTINNGVASSPTACEENVYMAKMAEQYKEMVEFMEKVSAAVDNEELSME